MTRAALAALAAAVALVAWSRPARASDDVAEARARLHRGAELYRAGRWRDAIGEFEAAYRLKPHGAIHFNVAQCREKLSEWPGALRAYGDYLREVPDAKDRAAVRAAMARIERRLAAAGVQVLLAYSDPPGAALAIDGRPVGTTPFHAVLPAGRYEVALTLDGYEPVREEVVLKTAASRTVDVVLRTWTPASVPAVAGTPPAAAPRPAAGSATTRLPSAAVGPAAPPAPAARAAGAPPPSPAIDLAAQPPRASAAPSLAGGAPPRPAERRRVYTWIAAGVAAAALAAGGYYQGQANADARAVRSGSAGTTTGALDRRIEDGRSKQRTATLLFAGGGAAAAAGVTLFFLEKRF